MACPSLHHRHSLVYDESNVLIANFLRVQRSDGNSLGYITLPNEPSIKVTFYDSTLLNGEIADPFYFYGWNIGNLPALSATPPATNPAPNVAQIVNQPEVQQGNNYTETFNNYGRDEIINNTYITPLLNSTSVKPVRPAIKHHNKHTNICSCLPPSGKPKTDWILRVLINLESDL